MVNIESFVDGLRSAGLAAPFRRIQRRLDQAAMAPKRYAGRRIRAPQSHSPH